MKVLFALNQDLNNDLEIKLLDEYMKEYGEGFEFDKAISIDEIKAKINDFDLLILNEELEINNPMPLEEIEEIKKIAISTRIILMASSENKTEKFIKELNNLGIYELMFSEDISIENIIFMIEGPKGKLEQGKVIEKKEIKKEVKKEVKKQEVKKQENLNKIIDNVNLHEKLIYKEKLLNTQVIAIGTAQRGAGSTYHSLSIANHLAILNFKVGIIEITENPSFDLIDPDMFKKTLDIYASKRLEASQERLINLCNEEKYDYIICDFGVIFDHEYYTEFLRANFKMLISFGDIWHTKSIQKIQSIPRVQTEKFPMLINFSNSRNVNKNANCIYPSEYNIDLFNPTESQKELYGRILQPILPKETRMKRNKILNWRD